MPCYANSTFRIDAAETVKFTAYTSSYTLLRRRGAARRKAANFQRRHQRVKNAVIRPRFQASTRAFLGRVGRASTALQIVRVAPSNCMAGIACWASNTNRERHPTARTASQSCLIPAHPAEPTR